MTLFANFVSAAAFAKEPNPPRESSNEISNQFESQNSNDFVSKHGQTTGQQGDQTTLLAVNIQSADSKQLASAEIDTRRLARAKARARGTHSFDRTNTDEPSYYLPTYIQIISPLYKFIYFITRYLLLFFTDLLVTIPDPTLEPSHATKVLQVLQV